MKKLHQIALVFLTGMSGIGYAQTAQVHIAGSKYLAVFADTSLSVTNQQRIAADLTTAFSLTTSSDKLESMLLLDELESIVVSNKNNHKIMQVAKPLSDKYLKAFAWMDANTNAVQKAHEFVALMNSPDLMSKPAQVLLNLGHFEPLSLIQENNPPSDTEIRAMIAKDFFPYKYFGISALTFYFKPISAIDDEEIPLIWLFVANNTDPTKIDAVPIGFYKGKWGFGGFPLPD